MAKPANITDPRQRLAQLCRSYPLLAAKLSFPRTLETWVARPRLVSRLNAARHVPLTAVVAPAGYGKTTLLSQWVAESDLRVGWVSLDDSDNDAQRFWLHALAALELAQPGVAEPALAQLHVHAGRIPIEVVLQSALNALALDDDTERVALVLDDLHAITADAVLASLGFFLDHLPGVAHVLVVSRVPPSLPLARMRVRQHVIELTDADLRFDLNESIALLNGSMQLQLPPADVARLHQHAEGWVAGLQLAALSLQSHDSIETVITHFGGDQRHVADYLTAEVLNKQPEARQRFLLQTSLLEQLNASLCDALTGRRDSGRMLRALERDRLFLAPLEADRTWYRYHPLFAGFLRECLRDAYSDEIPALHRRAAEWHAQHGLARQAIAHAFAVGDAELVATTALHVADDLWRREELAALRDWLERVPPELLDRHPDVGLYYAWSLFLTGRLEGIESRVQQVERLINAEALPLTGVNDAELRGMLFAVKGAISSALRQDASTAFECYEVALSLLPAGRAIWRGAALIGIGLSNQYAGNITAAIVAYRDGAAVSRAADNLFGALFAMSQMASLQTTQARLRDAESTLREAIRLGTGLSGRPLPMTAWAHAGLGMIHYLRNALEPARVCSEAALALAGDAAVIESAHICLANVAQARGEREVAQSHIEQAAQAIRDSPMPAFEPDLAVARTGIMVRQGKADALGNWAAQRGLDCAQINPMRLAEYAMAARVLSAQGKHAQALQYVEAVLPIMRSMQHHAILIALRITQALALHGERKATPALDALGQAMALASGDGLLRPFLDAGPALQTLVQHHAAQRGTTAFAAQLLAVFGEPVAPPSLLSEREMDVLRLIEAGLSNKQIAESLFIGVGTVKWHINNILGKLSATTRTSALARAREMKVL